MYNIGENLLRSLCSSIEKGIVMKNLQRGITTTFSVVMMMFPTYGDSCNFLMTHLY